jgi:hypothetical protein
MSIVIDFFREQPIRDDPLHIQLAAIPQLESELMQIRQKIILQCCDAELEKGGSVRLVIEDKSTFEALQTEKAAILDRLKKIDLLVVKLDAIFSDAEKQNIIVPIKTVKGVAAHRMDTHNGFYKHSKDEYDNVMRPIELLESRASALWSESGL